MQENKLSFLLKPLAELGLLIAFQCFLIFYAGTLTFQDRFQGLNGLKTLSVPLVTLIMGLAHLLIASKTRRMQMGPHSFSAKLFWIAYLFLNLIAVLVSLFVLGPVYAGIAFWVFVGLFMYQWKIRNWPLAGNLLISLLMMLSVLILRFIITDLQYSILLFFALFTFLSSFLFAWFKDIYTSDHDRLQARESLATLLGPARRALWSQILLIFFLSLLLVYLNFLRQYFFGAMEWVFLAYFALCVFMPAGLLFIRIAKETEQSANAEILNTLAYVRLTGVFAVLLF